MIEENSTDRTELSNLNFKNHLDNYLKYWKWFLLCILVGLMLAYFKLNFTRDQYQASATILIKNDNRSEDSKLSVFQDLGVLGKNADGIEDQIEILKSKDLIVDVVKALNLNIRIFTKKNSISSFMDDNLSTETNFFEVERYKNPPIKINFFSPDSIIDRSNFQFLITINSPTQFSYKDKDKSFKSTFGEKVSNGLGDFIITPNSEINKSMIGEDMLIKISSVRGLANLYSSGITVEPRNDFSNIIDLSFRSNVLSKAIDFLNVLITKYNERSVIQKELLTKSSSDFVNSRLKIIEEELSDIDQTAERFKTRYRISDVVSEAGYNLQSNQEIEKQIVNTSTQLEKIGFMKDLVGQKKTNELIPDVDVGDASAVAFQKQYNELMIEKQRLLKTSTEKNPIVVNISEQLETLKSNFVQSLDNLESTQRISLDALNEQDRRINSKLYSAPKKERGYRTITRQQQIKEQLFLYLLQKREEIAVTLGVAEPNAKIIDKAVGGTSPVSPNKKVVYMAGIFLGLLLPFGFIYLRDFLDTKIKNREDVQSILNIPILGDIPKVETKKRFLISKEDHSNVAEAFRILRTNLNFLLSDKKDKGNTIYITSTIAHEGKSLVSSNLAASLSMAGKSTLLLGMDIRAPKIKEYLGIRGNVGVTNFVINKNLKLEDITIKIPKFENLDLISSGDIPPNPSELLLNERIRLLFTELKKKYEYIIVDTAASSIITDTMVIKDYADAFVYVIRANYLDKRQLGHVKLVYDTKRYKNLALLVNGVDQKKGGYGYGYGYGNQFEKSKKKWWQVFG